jgi:hypothetical protein
MARVLLSIEKGLPVNGKNMRFHAIDWSIIIA